MLFSDRPNKQKAVPRTVLQRLAQSDQTAIQECIETYGDLIWTLVRAKVASSKTAERLTLEIFNDIWKCAKLFDSNKCAEKVFIAALVNRRLIVH